MRQVHESEEDEVGFLSTVCLDHSRDCLLGGTCPHEPASLPASLHTCVHGLAGPPPHCGGASPSPQGWRAFPSLRTARAGLGQTPGRLLLQDVRGGKATVYTLHGRTIRCVDVCPADRNLLMTGGRPAARVAACPLGASRHGAG